MQIFYARSCPLPRWPSTPGRCHALPQPGTRWSELIEPLRQEWGASEARTVDSSVAPGDRVRLSGALFHGVEAEVLCLLPARARVKVLLEFLGGPKEAEVEASAIVPVHAHPLAFPA